VVRTFLLLGLMLSVAWSGPAFADRGGSLTAEQRLAVRYAPVVRLVTQSKACGPGEPYRPSDVNGLLGNDTVALRGPWTSHDLIKVGPTARDLSKGLPGYSLDFPGNPLQPGCGYEKWADATFTDASPTVYAHVATEAAFPGRLAVEYWFYYPFNDYNNKHESDWERIQVEFDAADAQAALAARPTRVVYSEHEGSEFADWGAAKLGVVGGTHPVVYVSAGSHANHFGSALYLGRSASQGLGCDTTLGANTVVDPLVRTIPTNPVAAVRAFPWIGYQGTWGEQETRAFYTGPTGPNMKEGWNQPFSWSEQAASRSYEVPGGSVYGVKTTDFFCGVVGQASVLLLRLTANPGPTLALLTAALLVVVWLVRRTSWGASEPLPATRRRTIGQTMADAWELYRRHPLLYLGIGGWVALAGVAASLVTQLAVGPPGNGPGAAQSSPWSFLSIPVLLIMTLFSQAATVASLAELDADRKVGPLRAYRLALGRTGPLVATAALWLVALLVPLVIIVLSPLVVVVFVAFALYVPVVQIEQQSGIRALRRSAHLVRHQVGKVVLMLLLAAAMIALLGGLLGSIVILVVQAPFVIVNLIPGVVQALLAPFTSLMVGLAFFHGRARDEEVEEAGSRAEAEV
jgi:hypothetical protein